MTPSVNQQKKYMEDQQLQDKTVLTSNLKPVTSKLDCLLAQELINKAIEQYYRIYFRKQ